MPTTPTTTSTSSLRQPQHYQPVPYVSSTVAAYHHPQQQGQSLDQFDQKIKKALPALFDIFMNAETGLVYTEEEYAYLKEHTEQRTFQQQQQGKAELLHGFITSLNKDIRANLMVLGWMLTRGERMELYKYIGDGTNNESMKQWAVSMDIEASIRTLAITMANAWPYMRQLNYSVAELADPLYTTAKLTYIINMNRDATRQIKSIEGEKQQQMLLAQQAPSLLPSERPTHGETVIPDENEKYEEEEEEEEAYDGFGDGKDSSATPSDPSQANVTTLPMLTPSMKEVAYAEAYTQYVQDARAMVERVKRMAPQDFLYESTKQKGTSPGPSIFIHNLRQLPNGTWAFDSGLIHGADTEGVSEDEWKAMERNHYSLAFSLAGEMTTLSPKELGTYALDILYQEDAEGGSDDEEDGRSF